MNTDETQIESAAAPTGQSALTGNAFFRDAMARVPEKYRAGVIESWPRTPFMADIFVGRNPENPHQASELEYKMLRWLKVSFGPSIEMIGWTAGDGAFKGKDGQWRDSAVTMRGWRWFGFKSEELLVRFLQAIPQPDARDARDTRAV